MPRPAGALNSASRSAQVRWPLSIFLLFLLVLAQKTFTWLLGGPAAAAPRVLGRTARPGRRVRVVGAIELDQRVHLASLGRLVTIFLGVLALGLTKKCCSHLASRGSSAASALGRTARPGRRVRVVGEIELDQRVH